MGAATLVVCCGSALLGMEGCSEIRTYLPKVRKDKAIIPRSKFDSKDNYIVLRRSATVPANYYVSLQKDGSFVTVEMVCTHRRCELRPSHAMLSCPCHNSEFTTAGKVIVGPATEDLQRIKTTVDEDNVYVWLKNNLLPAG